MTKKLILFITLSFFLIRLSAQNIVVFQGFEGTAADNWSYTPPAQGGGTGQIIVGAGSYGAGYAKTGGSSMRAGGGSTACGSGSACCVNGAASGGSCNNNPNGKTVQFSAVNVECLSGVQISVAHRSHILCAGQGEGFDSGESTFFEISLNGGSWTAVGTLGGTGNTTWTYATNPAGSGSTVANPFVYNVPAGTVTVAFRTRCQSDRADEVYYIDDVKLTTTTNGYNFPGTAGIWNGVVNTDWTNKCNWENRTVPTIATDVNIPNSASNICEILSGLTGNCQNIVIDKSKLAVEYFTSTLNVNGNLTIDNNGELDMSLGGIEGGTLNIAGSWTNKRTPAFFDEGKSTVNFVGLANQSINVLNDTKEIFFKAGVNKPNGILTANSDVWMDTAMVGGGALLTLSNGLFDLNSRQLLMWNPNYQSIVRTGGGIISEKTDNSSKITWRMNSNTGNFVFPFIRTNGYYIPFTFNHTAGNAGDVTLATYGTPPNNLPWPTTPDFVTNLTSSSGLMPDNRDATVDRFWQIDVSGGATANLTFTYAPSELPIAPYNSTAILKAQCYETTTDIWQPYLPGQSAGAYFVTVPAVSTFSPWTLSNTLSPLPVSLLNFNAVKQQQNVKVTWTTVSEMDNDYFTIMRSKDDISFDEIGKVDGAGYSSGTINYHFTDSKPCHGISYYKLKQTDFNGYTSFSKTAAVKFSDEYETGFNYYFTDGALHLTLNEGVNCLLSIIDLTGKIVFSKHLELKKDNEVIIQETNFSKGVYIMHCLTDNESFSQKLIY